MIVLRLLMTRRDTRTAHGVLPMPIPLLVRARRVWSRPPTALGSQCITVETQSDIALPHEPSTGDEGAQLIRVMQCGGSAHTDWVRLHFM